MFVMDERASIAIPVGIGDNADEVDQHPDAHAAARQQLHNADQDIPGVEPVNAEDAERKAQNQRDDERTALGLARNRHDGRARRRRCRRGRREMARDRRAARNAEGKVVMYADRMRG